MMANSNWMCVVLCGVVVAFAGGVALCAEESAGRTVESFDFGWRFFKGDAPRARKVRFDDSQWRELDVPHDWSVEGPFAEDNPAGRRGGFLPGGVGWYRKHFRLPGQDKGKKVFIQFDGVYHNSEVWINGHYLGKRGYGYVSFQYDLTPYVRFGSDNVLSVRVDNSDQPNCRWYSGSGTYRHVWLTVTDKLHVGHWGTYVTTPEVSGTSATLTIKTRVVNEYDGSRTCTLVTSITDKTGSKVDETASTRSISGGGEFEFVQSFEVSQPDLWSIDNPVLYCAHSSVECDNEITDKYTTPFGIREIRFDKDKGFSLNGENMKMKGVCIHHDGGCVGAAVPDRVLERRLEILKELGCNAIRTSHNPPAPELLDMCDRMGFLVIDEAFDKWGAIFYRTFKEDWEKDLASMLWRDRNHPCVILWSVGNEVQQQGFSRGTKLLKMLVDFVHEHERTRLVTCALYPGGDREKSVNRSGFAEAMDVVSANYHEVWYESDREKYPDRLIIGSEIFPYYRADGSTEGDGKAFMGFVEQNPWLDVLRHDHVMGGFVWSGIDYLGESEPWPSNGWAGGIIDTCGFRKPISYFHQSVWSDKPMVHIAVFDESIVDPAARPHWVWPKMGSHWNFPHFKGKTVKLVTYTNCETVELVLNGKSQGKKKLSDFPNLYMTWEIPYEEGRIRAVGRDGDEVAASYELETAGEPTKIVLKPDRDRISSDARDVCHVEVNVTDQKEVLCPDAANMIRFEVEGPGKIIGVDNGNLDSTEAYKTDRRSAFRGRCLVIIQSTGQPGRIRLTAASPGLSSNTLFVDALE